MSSIEIEVEGLKELQAQLEQAVRDIGGPALLRAMRDAVLLVQRQAKINAPVDTGRLRASITPSVKSSGRTVQGVVGTNVKYAPFVEQPGPVRGVGQRPYLEPALTENADRIIEMLEAVIEGAIE